MAFFDAACYLRPSFGESNVELGCSLQQDEVLFQTGQPDSLCVTAAVPASQALTRACLQSTTASKTTSTTNC